MAESPILWLRIFDDPANRWTGLVRAELGANGILLHGLEGEDAILIPLGCDAHWPASTYLNLPCGDRTVIFTMAETGVDQVRLARDLAEWLQRKRYRIDLKDYRLPAYLPMLALLPLVLPLAVVWTYLAGYLRFNDGRTMLLASASVFGVSVLLFLWSFAGFPSVRIRVVIIVLVALFCNGVVATAWAHDTGELLDVLARFPGGPGTPFASEKWAEFVDPKNQFTIDMPGKVRTEAKFKSATHTVEYQHTFYTVHYFEFPGLGRISPEERLDLARRDTAQLAQADLTPSEVDVTHQGFPGREYFIADRIKGNLVVRFLIVGDRTYVFLAAAPRYTPETPDVRRFLSSFRVTKAER